MIWFVLILTTGIISYANIQIAGKYNNSLSKYNRFYDPSRSDSVQGFIVVSVLPVFNVVQLIRILILLLSNKLSPNPNW